MIFSSSVKRPTRSAARASLLRLTLQNGSVVMGHGPDGGGDGGDGPGVPLADRQRDAFSLKRNWVEGGQCTGHRDGGFGPLEVKIAGRELWLSNHGGVASNARAIIDMVTTTASVCLHLQGTPAHIGSIRRHSPTLHGCLRAPVHPHDRSCHGGIGRQTVASHRLGAGNSAGASIVVKLLVIPVAVPTVVAQASIGGRVAAALIRPNKGTLSEIGNAE